VNHAPIPSLVQAARHLLAALQRETAIARVGAVNDLAAAADAKRAAFGDFQAASQAYCGAPAESGAEREALRQVLAAADENAVVLRAVRQAVEDLPRRLRAAVIAAVDPGTYTAHGGGAARHVLAARISAVA